MGEHTTIPDKSTEMPQIRPPTVASRSVMKIKDFQASPKPSLRECPGRHFLDLKLNSSRKLAAGYGPNLESNSDDFRVAIIGGGPCGSYVGHLLSKAGIPNTIYEDNARVGVPEQCTGLFSTNMERFVDLPDDIVLGRVKGCKLRCGKKEFYLRTKRTVAYVTDRIKFDEHIAKMAVDAGTPLQVNHKYLGHAKRPDGRYSIKLRITQDSSAREETVAADAIVGADGPRSTVAKNSGLWGGRTFWLATQTFLEVPNPTWEQDMVELYFDSGYHENFFAWVVPMGGKRAKVGLASIGNPQPTFKRFLTDHFPKHTLHGNQGGLIPIYKKIPLQNGRVFLNGDAALQVKPTTGGGIVKGFLAAERLRDCIAEGTFDYDARLRDVHRSLGLHARIRDKLNRFDDKRYQELIAHIAKPRIKDAFDKYGDMDFPHKFVGKLLLRDPTLLKYLFA